MNLNQDQVTGIVKNSPRGQQRLKDHTAAEAAKEQSDCEALFEAYQKAVIDRNDSEALMLKSLQMTAGIDVQDYPAIRAMRDVALAAIELSKMFAPKQ